MFFSDSIESQVEVLR